MADEKNNRYHIKVIRDPLERSKAALFILARFYGRFGATPRTPELLFGALRDDGEVVGTLGLEVGEKDKPLPFEEVFAFEPNDLPFHCARRALVQYGRWSVVVGHVSEAMIYLATTYSLSLAKTHGCCVVKPDAEARLVKLGVELYEVPNAKVVAAQVSDEDQPYYLSDPRPKLFVVELAQVRAAVLSMVSALVSQGKLFISL